MEQLISTKDNHQLTLVPVSVSKDYINRRAPENQLVRTIVSMHENGFHQDFALAENGITWVQEQTFIKADDFSVVDLARFSYKGQAYREIIILSIVATVESIKGILIYYVK